MFQDIETPREDLYADLNKLFGAMFRKVNPDQNYGKEAILKAFADIDREAPEVVLRAYNLLQQPEPSNPLHRMELIHKLTVTSVELGILHTEIEKLLYRARIALYPPKTYNGESRTEAQRELIMDHKLAPFKAVKDIIYCLYGHCGKVSLFAQQSMLGFERSCVAEYIKGAHTSTS